MSRVTQNPAVAPIEAFQTSTDVSMASYAGQRFYSSDGREFVLAQNGATALVAGHLNCGPVSVANHSGLVVTAFVAASTAQNASAPFNPPSQTTNPATVTVTLGGTAVTANQYAGGYAVVATGTGIGQTLKIASHPAQTSTTGALVVTLEDAPPVALTTSSTVSLVANPFGSANGTNVASLGVVVASTTASSRGQIAGATLYAVPASTATVPVYGLLQTRGPIAMVNDAGTTKGLDLMPSSNTAGALMTYVVATSSRVGTSTETGTTTAAGLVWLQL